jgi:beta-lactam-binding protein with PASTA domain
MASQWELYGLGTISGNGTTAPTCVLPAGMPAGAAIVIWKRLYNVSFTCVTPTSGSNAYTIADQSWAYQRLYGWIAGSSEPNPTLGTDSSQVAVTVAVWVWVGGGSAPALASLFGVSAHASYSSTNMQYPALPLPGANGCLCLAMSAYSAATTSIADTTTNYVNRVDQQSLSGAHPISTIMDYFVQATAATVPAGSMVVTGGTSNFPLGLVIVLNPGTQSSNPAITSVGALSPGATGVIIAGSNFASSGNTVQITISGVTVTQTITSQSTTSITITVVQGNLPYGTGTLTVNNGSATGTFAITLNKAANVFSVNTTTLAALTFDVLNKPSRFYDTPTDIPNGAQIECQTTIVSNPSFTNTFSLRTDGTFAWAYQISQCQWRYWTGGVWSALFTWDLHAPFPQAIGTVPNQSYAQNVAIASIPIANDFVNPDPTGGNILTWSMSGSGNPLPTGITIASSTGLITGTPTVVGSTTNLLVQATDSYTDSATLAPFSIVVTGSPNPVAFNGPIPNPPSQLTNGNWPNFDVSPYFQYATSYSATGLAGSGLVLTGSLIEQSGAMVAGVYSVQITGSNTEPSSAVSNTFTITLVATAAQTLVPDVTSGNPFEYNAVITLYTSGLTVAIALAASLTVPAGLVISQSIVAGTPVAFGTLITITVSNGPGALPVQIDTAVAAIVAAGLNVVITYQSDPTVPAGYVISQNPPQGTVVPIQGTVVTLVCSTGPGYPMGAVPMPGVIGLTAQQAVTALMSIGISMGKYLFAISSSPGGTVIAQSVPQNQFVIQGTIVQLTLSLGPTSIPGTVVVPNI